MGCSGAIYDRGNSVISILGSGIGLDGLIWYWIKGLPFGNTGTDRLVDIKISSISTKNMNLHTLRSLGLRKNEIYNTPLVLEDVDLYFSCRDLMELEDLGKLTFTRL